MDNVEHKHTKLPITRGKTTIDAQQFVHNTHYTKHHQQQHPSRYKGMKFFDGGEEYDGESFDPGEFVVESVVPNNNFLCFRVVDGDETPESVEFDMSYVIERIRDYEEE